MKVPKTLHQWAQSIGLLIAFGMAFYHYGGMELRLFPTVQDQIHTIDHINGMDEFVKGLNNDKKERDTLQKIWIQGLVEMSKMRGDMNRMDSLALDINIRQANNEWEANKKMDSLIKYWDNYEKSN